MTNQQYTLRSGVEKKLIEYLNVNGIDYEYEAVKFKYTIPASVHSYTLDFIIHKPNKHKPLRIETKGVFRGRWPVADRKKHLYLRDSDPNIDIRFIFQNPNAKIAPNAKTTVSQWASINGFKWIGINDEGGFEEWMNE